MTRLREAFEARKRGGSSALVIYLTYGDPTPAVSMEAVKAAAHAGADVIELGVPFSDPSADGVVIQQAMERALAHDVSLRDAIAAVAELRAGGVETPVVLFGYYNPIMAFGVNEFAEASAAAGVDAVLTVDLPMDELAELHGPLQANGVGVIPLIAPTSTEDRIASVAQFDPPFVYYISVTGVTGTTPARRGGSRQQVDAVRRSTHAPVALGFGIKTVEAAREAAAFADGVVVGSAVIEKLAMGSSETAAERVGTFVAELRAGLDRQ